MIKYEIWRYHEDPWGSMRDTGYPHQGMPSPLCGAHGAFMFIVIAAVAAAHLHHKIRALHLGRLLVAWDVVYEWIWIDSLVILLHWVQPNGFWGTELGTTILRTSCINPYQSLPWFTHFTSVSSGNPHEYVSSMVFQCLFTLFHNLHVVWMSMRKANMFIVLLASGEFRVNTAPLQDGHHGCAFPSDLVGYWAESCRESFENRPVSFTCWSRATRVWFVRRWSEPLCKTLGRFNCAANPALLRFSRSRYWHRSSSRLDRICQWLSHWTGRCSFWRNRSQWTLERMGPQVLIYLTGIFALPQFGMWSTSSRLQIPLMQHPASWP